MAQPDEIPADLALEIGGNLDPKRFIDVARHFFGYVEEVTRDTIAKEAPAWEVIARQGSTILAMRPIEDYDVHTLSDLYTRFNAASASLIRGEVEDSNLSEKALSHIQMLAELRDRRGNKIPVRFWVRKTPTVIGPDIGEFIRESRGREYNDFGSLDGRLQTIQDAVGGLEFRIRDILYRNPVRCIVSEDMLQSVMDNFRKRVEVSGEIRYNQQGIPLAIRVQTIEPMPSDDELPTAEDVRGIFGPAAGDSW
ncbi:MULTISPECIES: hypothetical protein [Rhizobium]|uniref:hypothetical protein n=1 Tax=Rhizobium TaxID=379 RepID=UPI00124D119D|nr:MULTISPECIES: hypothetical protein [Rhizobium]KAF5887949.1 hypothetical protein FY112_01410 [Rhizobium sp. PEPV16]NKM97165.1 hypothetical protein [Rhizobium leguminosarum bv. viciae]